MASTAWRKRGLFVAYDSGEIELHHRCGREAWQGHCPLEQLLRVHILNHKEEAERVNWEVILLFLKNEWL